MANLIKLASSQIREIILESMGKMVSSGQIPAEPLPDFIVEIPADKSHGDFAANTAMVSIRMPGPPGVCSASIFPGEGLKFSFGFSAFILHSIA